MADVRCELCGDRGTPDDPVLEYATPDGDEGQAHIECAERAGWE